MPHPTRTWRRLPFAVRFLASHGALGFAAAGLFILGLLTTDPNGAGTLLMTGAGHWWPVAILWALTGSTFAGVQIGIAIMLMGQEEAPRPPGGTLAPALIRARARRR